MIQKYDVAIVGAASAGSYFARRMAERGFKVLLLERHSYERVGTKYDIFHIPTEHFEEFGLSKAVEEPNNQDYRSKMQNASTMAGMAFATVNLGVAHSIAHAFGGVFHVPHGLANAITLPVSIAYNMASPVAAAKYARLEKLCGVEDLKAAVEDLRQRVKVPATMREVVGDDEKYEQMSGALVAHALADLCSMTNPVPLNAQSMKKLMDLAYYGE